MEMKVEYNATVEEKDLARKSHRKFYVCMPKSSVIETEEPAGRLNFPPSSLHLYVHSFVFYLR